MVVCIGETLTEPAATGLTLPTPLLMVSEVIDPDVQERVAEEPL